MGEGGVRRIFWGRSRTFILSQFCKKKQISSITSLLGTSLVQTSVEEGRLFNVGIWDKSNLSRVIGFLNIRDLMFKSTSRSSKQSTI